MTATLEGLDPSLLDQLMERFAAKMAAAQVKKPEAADPRTVGDLWRQWEAAVNSPTAKAHAFFVFGLRLSLGGELVTLGELPWRALTAQVGDAWWAEMKRQPRRANNGEPLRSGSLVGAAYIARVQNDIGGMFSWHVKKRNILKAEHPLRANDWPKLAPEDRHSRKGSFRDEAELADFLQHVRSHDVADMMVLACTCGGMRQSEVRELRVTEVHPGETGPSSPWGMIRIPGWRTKTRRDDRVFPILGDRAAGIIARRIANAAAIGSDRIFPSPFDIHTSVSESGVVGHMKTAAKGWGATLSGERVTFHHCRHTFAKWQILLGTKIPAIMRMGGWKDPKIFQGYAFASDGMIADAAERSRSTVSEALAAAAEERRAAKPAPPRWTRGEHRSARHADREAPAEVKRAR